MAALPYIQLYVAEYLADTMHLTTEEHGAYLLLIMNYWQTGKPIPKKRLPAITRLGRRWEEVEPVLSELFIDDGENWIHTRIDFDLQNVKTKPRGKKLPNGESLDGYKGYIYFVTSDDYELVKIGYSKNPWARITELRRAATNEQLRVVATVKTVDKSERGIHQLIEEFRVDGEWYEKSDLIVATVENIKNKEISSFYELTAFISNYGSLTTKPTTVADKKTTVATTNKDTDPDTDTDNKRERGETPARVISLTNGRTFIPDDFKPSDDILVHLKRNRLKPLNEMELLHYIATRQKNKSTCEDWDKDYFAWVVKQRNIFDKKFPSTQTDSLDDAGEAFING